jgi:hypothetical protein
MIKRMIVTTAILSFFITAIKSDAEMKIAPGGVTFPDTTTQTTSATGGSGRWSANGFNIYYNSGNVGIGTSTHHKNLRLTKVIFSFKAQGVSMYPEKRHLYSWAIHTTI